MTLSNLNDASSTKQVGDVAETCINCFEPRLCIRITFEMTLERVVVRRDLFEILACVTNQCHQAYVIHIRIRLTDSLLRYGGHIGYGINPKYWKQGYGKELLRLGLEKYKDLIEEDKILITCDDDNIGSYKIIEANGGILDNKVENEDSGERFLTRRWKVIT